MAKRQEDLRDHFAGLAMAALITSRYRDLTPTLSPNSPMSAPTPC